MRENINFSIQLNWVLLLCGCNSSRWWWWRRLRTFINLLFFVLYLVFIRYFVELLWAKKGPKNCTKPNEYENGVKSQSELQPLNIEKMQTEQHKLALIHFDTYNMQVQFMLFVDGENEKCVAIILPLVSVWVCVCCHRCCCCCCCCWSSSQFQFSDIFWMDALHQSW